MILYPEFHARYGPWAVVAGASQGIGQAWAHVLAERGINLVTLARRLAPLEQDAQLLRRRHRVEVRPVALDLAAPELLEQFEQAVSGLDVGLLVYNACYSNIAEFQNIPLAEHLRSVDVNCRGLLTLTHAITPALLARGKGGLILMSSMAGFQGSALVTSYAATKAFTTNLAEGLWAELSPQGVDVLACVAGATSTPGFENSTPADKRHKAYPMRADSVAREGLAALGRKPVHVAGRLNRTVDLMAGLMSRKQKTRFFSNATRSIYATSED